MLCYVLAFSAAVDMPRLQQDGTTWKLERWTYNEVPLCRGFVGLSLRRAPKHAAPKAT